MSRPSMLVPSGRLSLPSLGGQQASFNFFITQCLYRAALINRPSTVNETVVCGGAPTKPRQVPVLLRGVSGVQGICCPLSQGLMVARRCSESCRRRFIPDSAPCDAALPVWTTVGLLGAGSAERYITSPRGLRDASRKQTFSRQK